MRIILGNFAVLKFTDYAKDFYYVCIDGGVHGRIV